MTAFYNLAISALDTPKSLIPFFVKDAFDITGRTIMANNEGGYHEAREKFVEEAGTSIFWIGGIPVFTAIANKLVKDKLDTDIHFKRINSSGIQNYYADQITQTIKENGIEITKNKFSKEDLKGIMLGGEKLGEIQQKLSKSGYIPNVAKGKYKKFHIGVSVAAVAVNFFMLTFALPKFNQFLSRKIISNEVNEKNEGLKKELNFGSNSITLEQFLIKSGKKGNNNGKNVAFGSLKELFDLKSLFNFAKVAENAQLNPTSSMLLLDYGISGSRVTYVPRDKNERIEYAVKEGGIIMFFYYAADWIRKGFFAVANKAFNTPIDLDYKIISNKGFLERLKTPHKKDELLNFVDEANELNIIKFVDKELAEAPKNSKTREVFKNFTLQMAQKEGLIDVEYDSGLQSWIRHSKKYIETEKLITLNNNLKNFYDKAFAANGESLEKIISKTKAVKAFSVIGNIAICCISLSYLLPKLQYFIREHRTKTCEAPGIKVYKDMAEKNMI